MSSVSAEEHLPPIISEKITQEKHDSKKIKFIKTDQESATLVENETDETIHTDALQLLHLQKTVLTMDTKKPGGRSKGVPKTSRNTSLPAIIHETIPLLDTAELNAPPPLSDTVSPTKPKRAQVKNACVNCQRACKKCDNSRPCQRCVKYHLESTCQNSTRKERKRTGKRGPYKRKQSSEIPLEYDLGTRRRSHSLPPRSFSSYRLSLAPNYPNNALLNALALPETQQISYHYALAQHSPREGITPVTYVYQIPLDDSRTPPNSPVLLTSPLISCVPTENNEPNLVYSPCPVKYNSMGNIAPSLSPISPEKLLYSIDPHNFVRMAFPSSSDGNGSLVPSGKETVTVFYPYYSLESGIPPYPIQLPTPVTSPMPNSADVLPVIKEAATVPTPSTKTSQDDLSVLSELCSSALCGTKQGE